MSLKANLDSHQLCIFRSKPCERFLKGNCSWEEKCQFSHHLEWVRRCPTEDRFGKGQPLYSSKLCKYISWNSPTEKAGIRTTCPKEKNCKFAHSREEFVYHPVVYKTVKCARFFKAGDCKRHYCPFAHTQDELRENNGNNYEGNIQELKEQEENILPPLYTVEKKADASQIERWRLKKLHSEMYAKQFMGKGASNTPSIVIEENRQVVSTSSFAEHIGRKLTEPLAENHSEEESLLQTTLAQMKGMNIERGISNTDFSPMSPISTISPMSPNSPMSPLTSDYSSLSAVDFSALNGDFSPMSPLNNLTSLSSPSRLTLSPLPSISQEKKAPKENEVVQQLINTVANVLGNSFLEEVQQQTMEDKNSFHRTIEIHPEKSSCDLYSSTFASDPLYSLGRSRTNPPNSQSSQDSLPKALLTADLSTQETGGEERRGEERRDMRREEKGGEERRGELREFQHSLVQSVCLWIDRNQSEWQLSYEEVLLLVTRETHQRQIETIMRFVMQMKPFNTLFVLEALLDSLCCIHTQCSSSKNGVEERRGGERRGEERKEEGREERRVHVCIQGCTQKLLTQITNKEQLSAFLCNLLDILENCVVRSEREREKEREREREEREERDIKTNKADDWMKAFCQHENYIPLQHRKSAVQPDYASITTVEERGDLNYQRLSSPLSSHIDAIHSYAHSPNYSYYSTDGLAFIPLSIPPLQDSMYH